MNHHDQEKLLKEILPPEDMNGFRNSSLEAGLAGLRRERRRRSIVRFSAVAVTLLSLSVGVLYSLRNPARHKPSVVQSSPRQEPSSLAAGHVEFITDEQLLAIYKNDPVALIGQPGDQHLVFLGKSEEDSAEGRN